MDVHGVMEMLLGLDREPGDFTVLQVCMRALVVFVVALVFVRFADRRFMARLSAFDLILALVLASVLSRAINGSADLAPSIAGALVLVLLHRFLAWIGFRSHRVSTWLKGRHQVLVRDGRPLPEALRAYRISDNDLLEELRLKGNVDRVAQVRAATIERNGQNSVIRASGDGSSVGESDRPL